MKKLLRTLLIVALSLTYFTVNAQNFVLKAGLNLSNMTMKDDDGTYSDDFKSRTGFHLGATALFPLSDIISVETGLLFTTRGFKIEESGVKGNYNTSYIDIPILAKGTFALDGLNIFAIAGPYVGIAVGGKAKLEFQGQTEEEDISIGSGDQDDLKRVDFGLTFGAGVEINVLQIGLVYDLGLANVSPFSDGGYKETNGVFRVSLGYIISR